MTIILLEECFLKTSMFYDCNSLCVNKMCQRNLIRHSLFSFISFLHLHFIVVKILSGLSEISIKKYLLTYIAGLEDSYISRARIPSYRLVVP